MGLFLGLFHHVLSAEKCVFYIRLFGSYRYSINPAFLLIMDLIFNHFLMIWLLWTFLYISLRGTQSPPSFQYDVKQDPLMCPSCSFYFMSSPFPTDNLILILLKLKNLCSHKFLNVTFSLLMNLTICKSIYSPSKTVHFKNILTTFQFINIHKRHQLY